MKVRSIFVIGKRISVGNRETLRVTCITALGALLISGAAPAAELHPIVEVQGGYLFGATTNNKWVKSEEAAKAISDERT